MTRRNRSRARGLGPVALLVVATVWSGIGSAAYADETPKVAVVVTAPDEVGAGTTTAFTVTITNQAAPQQLGSANITVPSGFLLLGAALQPPSAPGATVATDVDTVQLRSLAIPSTDPDSSQVVTVTALAPCSPNTHDTRNWSAIFKQANDFSGLPGNDFAISPASDLTTTITGMCSVGFAKVGFAAQPTSAVQNDTITAAMLDPAPGSPVKVALLDADGNVITAPSLQTTVTVSIDTNPGGGTLAGDTMEPTTAGIATFADLSIDQTGLGYTLKSNASTTDIDDGTSASFDIVDNGGVCSPGGCSHGASLGSTTSTLFSNSAGPDYTQFLVLDVENLDCAGYTEVTAVVTFGVSATSGSAQVTLTVNRKGLPSSRKSLNSFQVCYGSPKTFTPRPGTTLQNVGGEFVGLLPECADVSGAPPCIVGRTKTSKTFSITFSTPTGDPRGKG